MQIENHWKGAIYRYNKTITLNNGVEIPQLGLGTWFIPDDQAADAVKAAVQLGTISLPKIGNPEHMKTNAEVDFEISAEDMEVLKNFKKIHEKILIKNFYEKCA